MASVVTLPRMQTCLISNNVRQIQAEGLFKCPDRRRARTQKPPQAERGEGNGKQVQCGVSGQVLELDKDTRGRLVNSRCWQMGRSMWQCPFPGPGFAITQGFMSMTLGEAGERYESFTFFGEDNFLNLNNFKIKKRTQLLR